MFIPLHDNNRLEHIPLQWVTLGLIAANFAVFIVFQGAGAERATAVLATVYGVIPTQLFGIEAAQPGFPEEITLLTYMFLHGDWMHLIGNMLFLWVFGDNIEDALGHIKFLIFYLLCGVAGGLAHSYFVPNSDIPLVGASGAVAGIVAAYLILHPKVRVWVLVLGRIPWRFSALWVLGFWVGFQFFAVLSATEDNVSWWAHIGGIIAGAVLVVLLRRPGVPLFDRDLGQ